MFVRLACALLLLTAAAAAALAAPAGAEKPVRGPAASPQSLDFPAGVVCDFAVHAEALVNRQTETTFASGKVLYTGYFETLVAANGKKLRLNTSGPTRLTPEGDLLRVTSGGPLLIFFFPGGCGARRHDEGPDVPRARAHDVPRRPGDVRLPRVRDEGGTHRRVRAARSLEASGRSGRAGLH